MGRFLRLLIVLAVLMGAVAWWLTAPKTVPDDFLAGLSGDQEAGEVVFHASGCASCHSAPDASGEAMLVLAGGRGFASPFGTFYAPNISADPLAGIGDWSATDLANAMIHGTSPDGQHYYPAFPYASYRKIAPQDVVDLRAYLATLPADQTESRDHDVGFPFNIRRSLGGWKVLFAGKDYVQPAPDAVLERGRYLVEVLGHCAECHTPRNALGGLQRDKWMEGAPHPSGKGSFPAITPSKLQWSQGDLVAFFQSGLTPEFDSTGGEMTEVIDNLRQLPVSDQEAIAAYLLALD